MMIPLLLFYIMSLGGLLIHGFLHGKRRSKEECYYNLPRYVLKTLIEIIFVWWLLGWRVW